MKLYDDCKPDKYITYLDGNNLYYCAMSQYLPQSRFKWLNQKDIDGFDVNSVSQNSLHGDILEADLEYPGKLYGLHNDYPSAPEKLETSLDMLSKYCSDIADHYCTKFGGVNKLFPNLSNKGKYVLHYRNLQLHLSLGMNLIGLHIVLEFKKSDWLKNVLI